MISLCRNDGFHRRRGGSVLPEVWLPNSGQVAQWEPEYSYKQGELSEDVYDNWRYNFPNIQPTAGFVRNPISDELDAELQKTLNK